MTLAHFPGRDPFRMAAWQAPRGMRGWLTDDSSLTARIRSRCGRFSLQLVRQGKGCVLPDELAALGVQRHGALWQREVLLVADGEPVVFARSLVAATTIPAVSAGTGPCRPSASPRCRRCGRAARPSGATACRSSLPKSSCRRSGT